MLKDPFYLLKGNSVIQYIKAGKVSDFSQKNYKCLKILARSIVILKRADGRFYALEANCRHQNAPLLGAGLPKNYQVTCPRHQWRYDLKTGKCLTAHGEDLREYPLKVEGEFIFVGTRPLQNI